MTATHDQHILDQFTRQAIPFARLAAHGQADAMQRILAASDVSAQHAVLDVACGPGLLTCALAKQARDVTGIDMVPAMLERARVEQASRGLHNVRFVQGDARALLFPDAYFDRVVSRFSFHHLVDPAVTLAEMRRVCRPGGVVTVIDATPTPETRAAYDHMELLRDPSHVRALTQAELAALFVACGFRQPSHDFFALEVELEQQLAASFPEPGDAERIRALFRSDVYCNDNKLGVSANEREGQIYFAYPCSIFSAVCD